MSAALTVLGIITGTAVAWILNKILAYRIEDKNHRIGLKITAYIVCVILGISFSLICSLRILLDNFITDRVEFLEIKLAEIFPYPNILEIGIDTNDFSFVIPELRKLVNDVDTSNNGVFEKWVFDVFLNKLTVYVNMIEDGIAGITVFADDNEQVTIKSILYKLKNVALETVSPYFVIGQIGIVFLLLVFIGIYIGIMIFLKKGGAMYNKSIVFSDITYDEPRKRNRNTE